MKRRNHQKLKCLARQTRTEMVLALVDKICLTESKSPRRKYPEVIMTDDPDPRLILAQVARKLEL
jgi:hypothetical protein